MDQETILQKIKQAQGLLQECMDNLSPARKPAIVMKKTANKQSSGINFEQEERPFFKNNINKKMNGQKRFTLVVAYLARGLNDKRISKNEIEKIWKKVGVFMGEPCKNIYGTRAKDDEYLFSPEHGVYMLGNKWKNIFN